MEKPTVDSHIRERLIAAQELHADGRFEEAGVAYEDIVTDDPACGDAWCGLGTLALQVGEPLAAIDLLNKAIECDPTVAVYFINLGEAYRRSFNVEAAIAVLRVACDLDPQHIDAWRNLGAALGDQGDFAGAEQALKNACAIDPIRPDIYRNLGVAKQRQGKIDEAEASYRIAVALQPADVGSWCNLGETLANEKRHEEAVDAYRQALAVAPDNVSARIGLSMALSLSSHHEEATAIIDEILAADPNNHEALMVRGQTLYATRMESEAIACLQAAIAAAPTYDPPYRLLSAIHEKRGEFTQAGELCLRTLAFHPRDVSIMRQLAEVYKQMDENLAAIALLKQAVAMVPDDHLTLYSLGIALTNADRLGEGETHLRKATELNPEAADYWNALGWTLYRLDRMEDAFAAFDEGEARCPDSMAIASNRGAVMFDCGRFDEAMALFQLNLDKNPDNPVALGNIALVQSATGQLDEAAGNFERALAIVGENNPRTGALLFNYGTLELQRGRLRHGWELYARRDSASYQDHMSCPRWQGEPLAGKTILIWQDQGIGDQIMFGTMYQEIIDAAAAVYIDCHTKVLPLLRRSFPQACVFPRINPPHALMQTAFDYRAAAGDLPRWLRPTVGAFPKRKRGFLKVDKMRADFWRERLGALSPLPKIGICWRSKLQTTRRSQQYARLEDWQEVFALKGVTFINLQYDECRAELTKARDEYGVDIIDFPELNMHDDLDETSAMISQLDLVVSAPTAVAMMSAGLGVPTWNVLADYAWPLFGTKRHPFMPAIEKVYARAWNRPWADYLAQVAADLRQLPGYGKG